MLLRSPFDMTRSNPQALLGVGSTRAPARTKKFVGFSSWVSYPMNVRHERTHTYTHTHTHTSQKESVWEREWQIEREVTKSTNRLRVFVIVQNSILQLEPAWSPVLNIIALLGEPSLLGGILRLLSSQTLAYYNATVKKGKKEWGIHIFQGNEKEESWPSLAKILSVLAFEMVPTLDMSGNNHCGFQKWEVWEKWKKKKKKKEKKKEKRRH